MKMYGSDVVERPSEEPTEELDEPYRSAVRRDSARVLHSACFRRLQGKTQLFPANDSDFFRNRLTHSLEVGQVAKSIAYRVNHGNADWMNEFGSVDPDLCELAGWCHDLGHPPFGHAGEERLDHYMREAGGFEGNAQTLRILTRLEKKVKQAQSNEAGAHNDSKTDGRFGLNLTYRTLAAVLKYDRPIPSRRKTGDALAKGYYESERQTAAAMKKRVLDGYELRDGTVFKTVECGIMDLADDIAYSTYDLEDALKAGILNPLDILSTPEEIVAVVAKKTSSRVGEIYGQARVDAKDVRDQLHITFRSVVRTEPNATEDQQRALVTGAAVASRNVATNGYTRTAFTSALIGMAIGDIQFVPNDRCPPLSGVRLGLESLMRVEILKNLVFETVIRSPHVRMQRERARRVITCFFEAFHDGSTDTGELLPADVRQLYQSVDSAEQPRVLCDFVASMTDHYAAEYFERLSSPRALHTFKHLH